MKPDHIANGDQAVNDFIKRIRYIKRREILRESNLRVSEYDKSLMAGMQNIYLNDSGH